MGAFCPVCVAAVKPDMILAVITTATGTGSSYSWLFNPSLPSVHNACNTPAEGVHGAVNTRLICIQPISPPPHVQASNSVRTRAGQKLVHNTPL